MLHSPTLSPIENPRLAPLGAEADQVLIAANPRAGASSSTSAIAHLADALRRERLHAQVITDLPELTATAREVLAEGRLRAIVAAGGDGTLAELVNRTSPETPLAVFPRGTANLLAGYLGLQARPAEFAAMLAAGKAVRFDAGQVTWLAPDNPRSGAGQGSTAPGETAFRMAAPQPQVPSQQELISPGSARSRIFLVMAGLGFDAAVVERLHRHRTGHIRSWSYAKPILDSLRTYAYPVLRYECDASCRPASSSLTARAESAAGSPPLPGVAADPMSLGQQNGGSAAPLEARWLFVQNLPCYAGRLSIAPQAVGNDGLLDVCAFAGGSLWHGLKYVGQIWTGCHQRSSEFRAQRASRLLITADVPVPMQLDGDPAGHTPVMIEVLPARVRLIVPAGKRLEA